MPAIPTETAADAARTAVIDALLSASRAMVAIASRSLADTDQDVTLAQSRALVLMATRGPQRIIDIADDLGVAPSTVTRMCDRLVRKGLLRRYRTAADRREVKITLTPSGRGFVAAITAHRRDELTRVVDAIPAASHAQVASALQALNAAVGERSENQWWLGPETSTTT